MTDTIAELDAPILREKLQEAHTVIESLRDQNIDLRKKLEATLHTLDQMSRRAFGRSSERFIDPNQTVLDLGDLTPSTDALPLVELPAEMKVLVPGKTTGTRKPRGLPETLPLQEVRVPELPESHLHGPDGTPLVKIGEARGPERMHYEPPRFVRFVEITPIYGPAGSDQALKVAPLTPQLIEKGLPTTETVCAIAHQKFVLHQPLHRQVGEFARLGVTLAKSTICGWFATLGKTLDPVADAVREAVLGCDILHSDDIPIDQQDAHGRIRQSRFWSYLAGGQVWYDFTEGRGGEHPARVLRDFHGILMADGLAQYDQTCADNALWRLACWAHARRKFHEARTADARAYEILTLIKRLYAIEREAKDDPSTGWAWYRARWERRQDRCPGIFADIRQRLDAWHPDNHGTIPGTPLAKAIVYACNRWDELTAYAQSGDLPIDNNPAENAQRPIAIGRKNYLFLGSEGGGRIAATIYTLVHSCRIQGLDPLAYLIDTCKACLAGRANPADLTPKAVADRRL